MQDFASSYLAKQVPYIFGYTKMAKFCKQFLKPLGSYSAACFCRKTVMVPPWSMGIALVPTRLSKTSRG